MRVHIDVRRDWKCPQCGSVRKTSGEVSTQQCACQADPVWMQLVEERPPALPVRIADVIEQIRQSSAQAASQKKAKAAADGSRPHKESRKKKKRRRSSEGPELENSDSAASDSEATPVPAKTTDEAAAETVAEVPTDTAGETSVATQSPAPVPTAKPDGGKQDRGGKQDTHKRSGNQHGKRKAGAASQPASEPASTETFPNSPNPPSEADDGFGAGLDDPV